MKNALVSLVVFAALAACAEPQPSPSPSASTAAPAASAAPEAPKPLPTVPADGPKNIVHVAIGSKDHTTLVAALQAADYVDSLTNPGPFTVFAPTNAAFDKLPKGTVEALVKPDKQSELKNILQYHVTVVAMDAKDLKDGMVLGMANGQKATIHVKGDKISINDSNVVASIRAANGVVHVIDTVMLPPAK